MDELGFKIQSQPCNSEEEGLEVLFFFLGSAAPSLHALLLVSLPLDTLLCRLVGRIGLDHAVSPVRFVPRWVGLVIKEES